MRAALFPGLVLALSSCGGETLVHSGEAPETLCDFPGAGTALLPSLLADFGTSDAMGVNDHSVYLAESAGLGRVVRVARTGGPLTTLAEYLFYVQIAGTEGDAYLIAGGFAGSGSGLYRITREHTLLLLDQELAGANDLEVTPSYLYVADAPANAVYRYDRAGGSRVTVLSPEGSVILAAVDDTLYYAERTVDHLARNLYRLEGDGTSTFIAGGSPDAGVLFSRGDFIYMAGPGIRAYSLLDQTEALILEDPSGIQGVVELSGFFYFTHGSSHGGLGRVPVDGREAEVLDSDLGWGGIATDGSALYYDGGDVALVRCAELDTP